MTRRRQALRKSMPKAEVIMWSYLRKRQIKGLKFRRQYSVGDFIIDFYSPQLRLGIEIDGESHLRSETKDTERQDFIESKDIKLVRYWNIDIYENIDGVIEDLIHQIENIENS